MNNLLMAVEPWTLFVVGVGLFALTGLLAYQKKTAAAFVVLLGAIFSVAFLYLDHISEIAATATSLTIKVREASDALIGLRKVAALTGEALISLDAENGTIGGTPAIERDQRKQQVIEIMKSIGVDEATIKHTGEADRNRSLTDYASGILSHAQNCVLSQARQSNWQKDFNEMAAGWPPSPDTLQKLLDRYDVHDEFTNKALDEYRYFATNGEHRDAQFWRDRDSWPMFPRSPTGDNKNACRN